MSSVLVVGPSWVGDMVMAQSLFRLLKERASGTEIAVMAPAWSAPVVARMPEVSRHIAIPVGHGELGLGKRWRLGRELKGQFDQAIVLPNSLKAGLVPWFAGISKRTGFVGEQRYGVLNDLRKLNAEALPFCVQRFVALGLVRNAAPMAMDAILMPQLVVDQENQRAVAEKFSIDLDRAAVALCPGAEFGSAKQWPARYFAEVAKACLNQGRQVIVFGSEKDQGVAGEIVGAARGCIDLTGQTTLGGAIDLMALAEHVVTNDSGLMHIAAAVGCHVIALYGSSSDQFTPPLTNRADRLSLELSCRPCFQRTCPLGHLDCLNGLLPEKVVSILL